MIISLSFPTCNYMKGKDYLKLSYDIINSIKNDLDKGNFAGDIGNAIGLALSKHTCKNKKMTKKGTKLYNDFMSGLNHGISLHDGTH